MEESETGGVAHQVNFGQRQRLSSQTEQEEREVTHGVFLL